jgi:LacI family transcriptional regulator
MINASLSTKPALDRMEGYRIALEEAGLPFRNDRVFVSEIGKQDGFNREAGRASMEELIGKNTGKDRVTAVFIASDVQAMGALEGAAELGVRVPEDLAIVSFDDIELAQYAQLTTMRQPMYEMGVLALEKLHARMQHPGSPPSMTTFSPSLIVRRTCGLSRAPACVPAPGSGSSIELKTTGI